MPVAVLERYVDVVAERLAVQYESSLIQLVSHISDPLALFNDRRKVNKWVHRNVKDCWDFVGNYHASAND